MKKLIVLSSFVLLALGLNAQAFYFGGAYTGKTTWLLNKAVFDRGPSQDIAVSAGDDYGIVGGISFSDGKLGLEVNFLSSLFTQKYTGLRVPEDTLTGVLGDYSSKSTYRSIDIPVLFKTGGKGVYIEAGPVFSFISKATYERDYVDETLQDIEPTDNSNKYNKTNLGVILGFGFNVFLSDNDALRLTLGLRFHYGFSDIGGVNAYGWNADETKAIDEAYPKSDDHWGHNEFKTNPLSGGLKVGLIYVIQN